MRLKEIAHSRAGDKGNTVNISLIAYDKKNYNLIKDKVTVEKVKEYFSEFTSEVLRYELPKIGALNFVLINSLGGGVTKSVYIDRQGKTLSSALLDMEIEE